MIPKIAVIGCGYWGSNHIRTLKNLGALVAVSDVNFDHAQKIAAQYECEAIHLDYIFDHPNCDAFVLALPPQFHAQSAIRAVRAGKDVLVEKPIALNSEDAKAAVQAAIDTNRIFMVGHILRFHPAFEALQAIVNNGELGDIRYIHSHRLGFGKFHTETDALWDLAPHDLSMILALSGEVPNQVHGVDSAIISDFADFSHLHMTFPSGIKAHLFASRLNPYKERRLSVVGTKAMAVYDDSEDWDKKVAIYHHKVWKEDNRWDFSAAEPHYIPVTPALPLTVQCQNFIDCIITRTEPRTNGQEAIAVIEILTRKSAF
jgi:predicted dehydrogenase